MNRNGPLAGVSGRPEGLAVVTGGAGFSRGERLAFCGWTGFG